MPVTYRNRKGYLYYLHRKFAKSGKPRYVFSREATGDLPEQIPSGFEIVENVNGVVSPRRIAPPKIPDGEVAIVESVLERHPHLEYYKVEAKKKVIVVFEPLGALSEAFLSGLGGRPRARDYQMQRLPLDPGRDARYEPVMRFRLVDAKARTFMVDRMCYRSSIDGWLSLFDDGRLPDLARRYLPHLGKESFFELY